MSGRIRYIDQAHHVQSLFRQQSEEERRETLVDMAEIVERRFSSAQMGDEELKAATTLRQMIPQHLGRLEPLDPWALGHLAIDWGNLDLSSDLKEQFDRLNAKAAGQRSGESRRLKAETTWHPHALDLAKAIRGKLPSLAQDDLAAEIKASWTNDGWQPGHHALLNFVRASEVAGTLVKRVA